MATKRFQSRVDSQLLSEVEEILTQQGIRTSWAVHMLFFEIKKQGGMPFWPSEVPNEKLARDLRKAESGIGVGSFASVGHMLKSLKRKP